MSDRKPDPGLLGVVWSILVLQGGITLVAGIEGVIGGVAFGSIAAGAMAGALGGAGALLALVSARGIRRRRRWARRLTLIAEWLVLATGVINLVVTGWLAQEFLVLVPFLTTIVAPVSVIVMLRRLKPVFFDDEAAVDLHHSIPEPA